MRKIITAGFLLLALASNAYGQTPNGAGSLGAYYVEGISPKQHTFDELTGRMIMQAGDIGFAGYGRNTWGAHKNDLPVSILYRKNEDILLMSFGTLNFEIEDVSSGDRVKMIIDEDDKQVFISTIEEVVGTRKVASSTKLKTPVLIAGRSILLGEKHKDGTSYIDVDVITTVGDISPEP
jgi:hypothetical protein